MFRLKRFLGIVMMGALLLTNVVPVNAAESTENVKIESLGDIDLSEYSQYIMSQDDVAIQPKAPAPALTSFYLYSIYSAKAGEEIIQYSSSSAQVGSRLDHGGTWFQAITVEIGYARTRYAYFNGNQMTLTDTASIDLNNDSIVDGYLCLWTYEGYEYEAGTFTANSTSANSPWNTMSIRFNVY